jgi:hypothetical protein
MAAGLHALEDARDVFGDRVRCDEPHFGRGTASSAGSIAAISSCRCWRTDDHDHARARIGDQPGSSNGALKIRETGPLAGAATWTATKATATSASANVADAVQLSPVAIQAHAVNAANLDADPRRRPQVGGPRRRAAPSRRSAA